MTRMVSHVLLPLAMLAGAAATSRVAAQEAPSTPVTVGKFAGSFRAVASPFASMGGGTSSTGSTTRYTGTIELTPSVTQPKGYWHVELHVSSPRGNETLEWGLSKGRCGSALMLLDNSAQLAPVDMRRAGVGDLIDEIKFDLMSGEQYQALMFRGGRSQQNVITCANLRYSDKK